MSFASLDAGAIPLVTVPDDDSSTSGVGAKFEVNPEAISYLQSIRGKARILSSPRYDFLLYSVPFRP